MKVPRAPALQVSMACAALLLFAGIYLVSMRLSLDASVLTQRTDADRRDRIYLAIHGVLLLAAAVGGFGLGRWLCGLGLAYSVLFVVVLSLVMVGAQLGSYEMACAAGHNDLIRRWTC